MPCAGRLRVLEPVVNMDEDKPGKPVVAVHFLLPNFGKVTADHLANLKSFPNLRSVECSQQEIPLTLAWRSSQAWTSWRGLITDAALLHLKSLTDLDDLDLDRTAITPTGEHQSSASSLRTTVAGSGIYSWGTPAVDHGQTNRVSKLPKGDWRVPAVMGSSDQRIRSPSCAMVRRGAFTSGLNEKAHGRSRISRGRRTPLAVPYPSVPRLVVA